MTIAAEPAPKGFVIGTTAEGESQVSYRTTGMASVVCFLVVVLTALTAFCLLGTIATLFGKSTHDGDVVYFQALLMLAPFWIIDIVALHYMAWHVCAVTVFTFRDDELRAERLLWRWSRRRIFKRSDVECVRQVATGDGGDDDWGVAIVGVKEVRVLTWQPERQAAWLAERIAAWAGVPFNPRLKGKQKLIEWL